MIFLKLLAFLKIVKLVWLEDFEGETYLSIKRKNAFGFWCYPMWTYVGHVNLLDGGKCSGKSTYIEKWRDY